jgi:hypothetical protein
MKTTDIRVRPVIRHAVTRYTSETGESGFCSGGSESLGEFSHEAYAEEVAEALKAAHKPKQYALVERGFDTSVQVYYAEEPEQAEYYKRQLEAHYGAEFRVFEREVTDPIVLGRYAATQKGTWAPLTLAPLQSNQIAGERQ